MQILQAKAPAKIKMKTTNVVAMYLCIKDKNGDFSILSFENI